MIKIGQVKIYVRRENFERNKNVISKVIHEALVDGLKIPQEKKFQSFIVLNDEECFYPADRSKYYTIVEIGMFTGRSI